MLPVYVLDPRQLGTGTFGFPKTGAFRLRFLLESLADLRARWQASGGELLCLTGHPETVLPDLARRWGATDLFAHQLPGTEEETVEEALTASNVGDLITWFWSHTLYHLDDLPFDVQQLPDLFTQFRNKVENNALVRNQFPIPNPFPKVELTCPDGAVLQVSALPTLGSLGFPEPVPDSRGVLAFKGGETEGLKRVEHYFWQHSGLRRYKETRNGMLGADYSSKFSPWLALGCLSPRFVHDEVRKYERKIIRNDSTYWLLFELLWRDFFAFTLFKHGARLFQVGGLLAARIEWRKPDTGFEAWCQGQTGYPIVDANMRELQTTGFMSNRGRQIVASFLTKNLGMDWRAGAEWFESLLIDYDPASNYGNWTYAAGVGNDARGFRYFHLPTQARNYDPDAQYIKHWLPELKSIPARLAHFPAQLSPRELANYGIVLGQTYPKPVCELDSSVKECERIYNKGLIRSGKQTNVPKSRIRRFSTPKR